MTERALRTAPGNAQDAAAMTADPGTYVVLFRCPAQARVQVGRWGPLTLRKGCYLYVGSAFGPGGVRARVARHCREDKARRWHIDYLGGFVTPLGAWYSHASQRLEHRWALALADMPGAVPVVRFGSSDCRCESHLYYFAKRPDLPEFQTIVQDDVQNWSCC